MLFLAIRPKHNATIEQRTHSIVEEFKLLEHQHRLIPIKIEYNEERKINISVRR